MVICAACKAYTDDENPNCEQCGAPLQADHMERVAQLAQHPVVAGLAQDSERALLVASAVVATNRGDFFYADGQGRRTILVQLFGSARDPKTTTAGVIFAAYSYLDGKGYCSLVLDEGEEHIRITGVRPWNGQQKCVECVLAEIMPRVLDTYEATDRMLRELMSFRAVTVRARAADGSRVQSMPELSAVSAVNQTARLTVLPEHDAREACQMTYRLLARFVEADGERARQLALETVKILESLEAY